MKMENKFNLVAARRSAALFTNTSHLRFAKRRCDGLATLALGFLILHSCFCLRILGQQYSNNLSTGTWGDYAGAVVNNSVTNSPLTGNLFFRLKQ